MAIAQAGNWTSATYDNSTGGTLAGRTSTAGNLVAITASSSSATPTFSHSQAGTVQTARTWENNTSDNITTRYIENIAGGASHTITLTAPAGSFSVLNATEYSGLATSTALDKTNVGTGNSTSLLSAATATTTVADELLVGNGTISVGTNSTWTAGTNYTLRGNIATGGSGAVGLLEDRIVAATGAYTASATWGGSGGVWICTVCTFKAPGGGGPPDTPWMRHRKRTTAAALWIPAAARRAK